MYKERINELTGLKYELQQTIQKRTETRNKYLEYLKANPYKKEWNQLNDRVEALRNQLMNLIPNKFGA